MAKVIPVAFIFAIVFPIWVKRREVLESFGLGPLHFLGLHLEAGAQLVLGVFAALHAILLCHRACKSKMVTWPMAAL